MEETSVVIVGAGPSGLVLGALLGRMNVKVVILEKELEVCEDPRGIVVNGDAVRISYQVGIGDELTKKIGSDLGSLNFHRGNFRTKPFMAFNILPDWAGQSVSQNIAQFQPNYEREIRNLLRTIPSCSLRIGCEVLNRVEKDNVTEIEYLTPEGDRKWIRTSWLVGADGKRGVVRKKFLEPEGIKQVDAVWPYVGTWVAINLEVDLPTPETHPDFPLWDLGYTPEEVHAAFWPKGFHFCNDPVRPAVSGRFGPKHTRFWRHEYSIGMEEEPKDCVSDFWDHFLPWMVLPGSQFSNKFRGTTISYPRDCIKVLRCRPFRFATKVVNRWFHNTTMLIGDAAHVFPPFGGQGIATGIRDAQALSWRLAILGRLQNTPISVRERILTGWSQERRHAWEIATLATKMNGSIVNQSTFWSGLFFRFCMRVLWAIPGVAKWRTQMTFRDKLAYNGQSCPDGFFLEENGGGRKIGQAWLANTTDAAVPPQLSDEVIFRDLSRLSILVLVRTSVDIPSKSVLGDVLRISGIPVEVLGEENITYLDISKHGVPVSGKNDQIWRPCSTNELEAKGIQPILGYNKSAIHNNLPFSARFVILRPDFFIHSIAGDLDSLRRNLGRVKQYFMSS
ncbi:conserved hypothetical protein [Talaromyces stipitatus ATCC 10500]|uniref:FAD-binding domain-containing protein n=1 Tax=Talaromyces stipitatus (strain ATCC 10500 / CBS 375.48 / QM 6759 / NRRL 1006) TaxID=441959 RepID=B8MKV2_TALSN|nr:uncharacterized protein TSTA_044180 [Talaromyces stipitatus ATCC 10500]EED14951.1 conserved hypothetical protein [Talaromyces stipitatus ATCC 10500]